MAMGCAASAELSPAAAERPPAGSGGRSGEGVGGPSSAAVACAAEAWLAPLRLAQYAPHFLRAGYDDEASFAGLVPEDVAEVEAFCGMDIPPGHRKRLFRKMIEQGSMPAEFSWASSMYTASTSSSGAGGAAPRSAGVRPRRGGAEAGSGAEPRELSLPLRGAGTPEVFFPVVAEKSDNDDDVSGWSGLESPGSGDSSGGRSASAVLSTASLPNSPFLSTRWNVKEEEQREEEKSSAPGGSSSLRLASPRGVHGRGGGSESVSYSQRGGGHQPLTRTAPPSPSPSPPDDSIPIDEKRIPVSLEASLDSLFASPLEGPIRHEEEDGGQPQGAVLSSERLSSSPSSPAGVLWESGQRMQRLSPTTLPPLHGAKVQVRLPVDGGDDDADAARPKQEETFTTPLPPRAWAEGKGSTAPGLKDAAIAVVRAIKAQRRKPPGENSSGGQTAFAPLTVEGWQRDADRKQRLLELAVAHAHAQVASRQGCK